ncbi:hypothetical protein Bca4012_027375 [Brassica carinata]
MEKEHIPLKNTPPPMYNLESAKPDIGCGDTRPPYRERGTIKQKNNTSEANETIDKVRKADLNTNRKREAGREEARGGSNSHGSIDTDTAPLDLPRATTASRDTHAPLAKLANELKELETPKAKTKQDPSVQDTEERARTAVFTAASRTDLEHETDLKRSPLPASTRCETTGGKERPKSQNPTPPIAPRTYRAVAPCIQGLTRIDSSAAGASGKGSDTETTSKATGRMKQQRSKREKQRRGRRRRSLRQSELTRAGRESGPPSTGADRR